MLNLMNFYFKESKDINSKLDIQAEIDALIYEKSENRYQLFLDAVLAKYGNEREDLVKYF